MSKPLFPSEQFTYQYLAGPVASPEIIDAGIKEGNCRFALQLYFYRIHGIFLKEEEIYLPGAYKSIGTFIFEEQPINYDKLKSGDIIYAQNLRNKKDEVVDKSPEKYETKDIWLYNLHSAIYIGKIDDTENRYIWHATSVENGTAFWTLEKFHHYYKPISAKRVLK